MFRRPRRPLPTRYVANNAAIDGVVRANKLMAAGQTREAAVLFIELAREMQASGHPRQAANMHALAANAWLSAGVEERALNQAAMAMRQFNNLGMWQRAQEFKTNFIQHLREKGSPSASALDQEFTTPVQTRPAAPEPVRGVLPPACPHCGAPVRSDMVEWIDAHSAECGFCSGVIVTK